MIDAGQRGSEQLKTLHQHGIRFCLVDFGRDWAAVHALKNFHVDFVRLSPTLVAELGSAKSLSDTLLALVRKAHSSGAAVIAPEIDNMQRAHLLLRLGVDYGCGSAFGRPQPQPDFDFAAAVLNCLVLELPLPSAAGNFLSGDKKSPKNTCAFRLGCCPQTARP